MHCSRWRKRLPATAYTVACSSAGWVACATVYTAGGAVLYAELHAPLREAIRVVEESVLSVHQAE